MPVTTVGLRGAMDTRQMLDRVSPLFESGGRFFGRYLREAGYDPVEVHLGATWELPVFPIGSRSPDVMRIYSFDTTAAPLLQAHWRNETRALLRLSTRGLRTVSRGFGALVPRSWIWRRMARSSSAMIGQSYQATIS